MKCIQLKYFFAEYRPGFVFPVVICFLSSLSFGQHLKVIDGDSIYTEISVWETMDQYDYKKTSDFNPKCINTEGDTLTLTRHLYEQYNYSKFCRDLAFISNKTYLTIETGENGTIKAIDYNRKGSCEKETEIFTELIEELEKILVKPGGIFLVVSVRVIPTSNNTLEPIKMTPVGN